MNIPELLVIHCLEEGDPAKGVLAFIEMHMPEKNSSVAGPFVSDASGAFSVARSLLEHCLRVDQEENPMDYVGSLADVRALSVVIPSGTDLAERIQRLRAFYPDDAEALAGIARESRNERYDSTQRLSLPDGSSEHLVHLTR